MAALDSNEKILRNAMCRDQGVAMYHRDPTCLRADRDHITTIGDMWSSESTGVPSYETFKNMKAPHASAPNARMRYGGRA